MGLSPSTCATPRVSKARSAAFPKAPEQPADASREQYARQRLLPKELLALARDAVDFLSRLLTAFRGLLADLPELLLGSIPDGFAHFLNVFNRFFRLFCQAVHLW